MQQNKIMAGIPKVFFFGSKVFLLSKIIKLTFETKIIEMSCLS